MRKYLHIRYKSFNVTRNENEREAQFIRLQIKAAFFPFGVCIMDDAEEKF